jgi:DnaJ-class molecular chaperone
LQPTETNHYATLGLDRYCTMTQIRTAYRLLARQHHPDLNPNSPEAPTRTQALNAAYKILCDPTSRRAYDRALDATTKSKPTHHATKIQRNISQDIHLRIEDFLRGTTREIQVKDPAHPVGSEVYELIIPPGTAPGARFRLPREEPFAGGFVQIRVRPLPSFRFKVRGSDLRCDLKIRSERAVQGGTEVIAGVIGGSLRVQIPRGVGRGEIIPIPGEGLPKPRGGRGDLLVRITYRPEVRVSRPSKR